MNRTCILSVFGMLAILLTGCVPASKTAVAETPATETVAAEVKLGKTVAGPPVPPSEASAATPSEASGAKDADLATMGPASKTLDTGLVIEDLKVGTGDEAKAGTKVTVHYTGWLTTGKKFDSSVDRNEPFEFDLPGQVIKGWNDGVPGMKVGGKRKLKIPPALGYGDQGAGNDIPPGATLIFEVELLKVGKS